MDFDDDNVYDEELLDDMIDAEIETEAEGNDQDEDEYEESEPQGEQINEKDATFVLGKQLRDQFLRKYKKLKFVLLFDKAKTHSKVFYFLVNPVDGLSILPKSYVFQFGPLRDLVFYRAIQLKKCFYIIGGVSSKLNKVSARTFVYDSERNTWRKCANLNVARCKFSVSVVKNKIYVVGGQDVKGTPFSSIEVYDPKTDSWDVLGDVAKPIKYHSSCVLNDRYLVISGGEKMKTDNFMIYDAEYNDWRPYLVNFSLPIQRENHAMIEVDGQLYVIGGLKYYSKTNDPADLEPVNENSINSLDFNNYSSVKNGAWKSRGLPNTVFDRNGCALCSFGNYIYIFGGHTVENNENDHTIQTNMVERFDTAGNKMETAFELEEQVSCFDVDCCALEIDASDNDSFKPDALFHTNLPLW